MIPRIEPTDLPEVRKELFQWLSDGRADYFWKQIEAAAPWDAEQRLEFATTTAGRAELFYASPTMIDLARHACDRLFQRVAIEEKV